MCAESQRNDALNAVTLVENVARLATQGLFGFVFASLAGVGKAYATFFCNAVRISQPFSFVPPYFLVLYCTFFSPHSLVLFFYFLFLRHASMRCSACGGGGGGNYSAVLNGGVLCVGAIGVVGLHQMQPSSWAKLLLLDQKWIRR